jgi:PiT family inorganic phosphate transporter
MGIEIPIIIIVIAIAVSFYASFMGGANDFANAFGTSVGSKAITIPQAVMIAIVAELLGAVLVGASVTNTVRKGIVDPMMFEADPMILVYGLLAALVGSGLFLQIATNYGLPVSTTHSIVGAMVGFGIVATGFAEIQWGTIGTIAMSWVVSPIGGGIVAFGTFKLIQSKVLGSHNPIKAAQKMIPFFVGLTVITITLATIYKGLKNLHLDMTFTRSLSFALVGAVIISAFVWYRMRKLKNTDHNSDIEKVEGSFKVLQIFTAGYVAFAHGSNDVANSIGPLAGIWSMYKTGTASMQSEVPFWILLLGGTGIVLGLAIFGYKVIDTVGRKITKITPSRGFAAEFAAATVVLGFSKAGMPVSTTHTLVGSVIGVGLARGLDALDFRVVKKIFMSWVFTIPIAAGVSAITFVILRALLV